MTSAKDVAEWMNDRIRGLPPGTSAGAGRKGDWMQSYSGRQIFPFDPRPEEVSLVDIAHALSLLCRFGGHCLSFYSVAEHSVRASYIVPEKDALWALMHDASEAYLVDMPRPIKRDPSFAGYRAAEARLMAAVCERFGLSPEMPASVKKADEQMLATEQRDLMTRPPEKWYLTEQPLPGRIEPWTPAEAEARFLARYAELTGEVAL